MRVLVVDEEVPWPLDSGKKIRTFNLLKHLASRHEIHYLCRRHEGHAAPDTQPLQRAGIQCKVVPDPIPAKSGLKFYGLLLANLFSPLPYSVTSHQSRQLVDEIRQALHRHPFDLIHCEWTPYYTNLTAFHHLPNVVVAHNVEATIWQRNFELETDPLKKAYVYTQWKKMKRFEEEVFKRASTVVVVSPHDGETVSRWRGRKNGIVLVENGVDVDYFSPQQVAEEPRTVVFTGSLDWRPNVDAMMFFLDEVWQRILSRSPKSRCFIVGRNPMSSLRDRVRSEPSVTLTGTVADVRPFIERSAVYIVPLRIGGGSRLKILEALSMEKPVVSTSVGAEGLRAENGREIHIADTPAAFAEAVLHLFSNPDAGERLGVAGRSLVESSYRWEVLAKGLERAWVQAVMSTEAHR
jgi:sugar transferase (PEP-CTERM/EpsH1 system associated)